MTDDHDYEWESQLHLNIRAVNALEELLKYFIEKWPGSPARPAEEQEFARTLLECMHRLKLEHSFDCLEMKNDDRPSSSQEG